MIAAEATSLQADLTSGLQAMQLSLGPRSFYGNSFNICFNTIFNSIQTYGWQIHSEILVHFWKFD
jgi:hypothetical protein